MHIAPLRETVDSGQVSLDQEAGERLRTMLTGQLDQVDTWLTRVSTLARPAQLGTNPVAQAMAAKFELRAHGDPLSFVSVLTAYRDVLGQTLDAVTRAIDTLQQSDADSRAEFRRLGRDT